MQARFDALQLPGLLGQLKNGARSTALRRRRLLGLRPTVGLDGWMDSPGRPGMGAISGAMGMGIGVGRLHRPMPKCGPWVDRNRILGSSCAARTFRARTCSLK